MLRSLLHCCALCLLLFSPALSQVTAPPPAWAAAVNSASVLLAAAEVPGSQLLESAPLQARSLVVPGANGAETKVIALEGSASIGLPASDPPLPPIVMMVRVFGSANEARLGAALAGVYRVNSAGEPEADLAWMQGRNDLGDAALVKGEGASVRPDPARVVILFRHLLCDVSMEPRFGKSGLVIQAARAWVAKVKSLQPPLKGGAVATTKPTTPPATTTGGATAIPQPPTINLTGPSSSVLIERTSAGPSFGLTLRVTWQKGGTILDTVGLLGAAPGSFGMQVDGNGKMWFQVYAPSVPSAVRNVNGWHILTAKRPLPAGQPCTIAINADGQTLSVDFADAGGSQRLSLALPLALVRVPLYAGDFPGDNHLPAAYGVHKGMTGTVQVLYCGSARKALVR